MAKKINTLEKFYNHLCDTTSSTWTGVVVTETKHMFQDVCLDLNYKKIVEKVIENIPEASIAGVEDGMIFTDNTEYRMPIPLLGKLAESFIAKVNENESEVFLANLKAKMEA